MRPRMHHAGLVREIEYIQVPGHSPGGGGGGDGGGAVLLPLTYRRLQAGLFCRRRRQYALL